MTTTARSPRVPLRRQPDGVLTGVARGIALHLGVPVLPVRIGFVATSVLGGAGVLFYLWCLVCMQPVTESRKASTILQRPAPEFTASRPLSSPQLVAQDSARKLLLVGLLLLTVASVLLLLDASARIPLRQSIPLLLLSAGLALAWVQVARYRAEPERFGVTVLATVGAVGLVVAGLLLVLWNGREPSVWMSLASSFAMLVGVLLIVAPWLLTLNRELLYERTARARETERADIAAHLHDSVLQTLALIQQKSEPHSEVARLARAQERDLRSWLFAPSASAEVDTATELARSVADIESRFPVRIDVVLVGSLCSAGGDALLGAAREAMLNAARHAGGDIAVFGEARPESCELRISDRGAGFDLASVAVDRHGVRESIVGRMLRAGGSAHIGSGRGGVGTEVVLVMPHDGQAPKQSSAAPAGAAVSPARAGASSASAGVSPASAGATGHAAALGELAQSEGNTGERHV